MAILDIEVPDELLSKVKRLAVHLYGDSGELSQAKIIESAISMRLIWFHLLNRSDANNKHEIDVTCPQ